MLFVPGKAGRRQGSAAPQGGDVSYNRSRRCRKQRIFRSLNLSVPGAVESTRFSTLSSDWRQNIVVQFLVAQKPKGGVRCSHRTGSKEEGFNSANFPGRDFAV